MKIHCSIVLLLLMSLSQLTETSLVAQDCDYCEYKTSYSDLDKGEKNSLFNCWAEELSELYDIHFQFVQNDTSGLGTLISALQDNETNDGFWCAFRIKTLPQHLLEFLRDTGATTIQISWDKSADSCGVQYSGCASGGDLAKIHFGNAVVVIHELGHILANRLKNLPYSPGTFGFGKWNEINEVFFQYDEGENITVDDYFDEKCPDPLPVGYVNCYALTNKTHDFVEHLHNYANSNLAPNLKILAVQQFPENSKLWEKYEYLRTFFKAKEYTDEPDPETVTVIGPSWTQPLGPGEPFKVTFEVAGNGLSPDQWLTPVLTYDQVPGVFASFFPPGPVQGKGIPKDGMKFEYYFYTNAALLPNQVVKFKFYLENSAGKIAGQPYSLNILINAKGFTRLMDENAVRSLSYPFKSFQISPHDFKCENLVKVLDLNHERVDYGYDDHWAISREIEGGAIYNIEAKNGMVKWKKHLLEKPTMDYQYYDYWHENSLENIQGARGHKGAFFEKLWTSRVGVVVLWASTSEGDLRLYKSSGAFLKEFKAWKESSSFAELKPTLVGSYDDLNSTLYLGVGKDVWAVHPENGAIKIFELEDVISALFISGFSETSLDLILVGTDKGDVNIYKKSLKSLTMETDGKKQLVYYASYILWDAFKVSGKVFELGIKDDNVYVVHRKKKLNALSIHKLYNGKPLLKFETPHKIKMMRVNPHDGSVVCVLEINEKLDRLVRISKTGKVLYKSDHSKILNLEELKVWEL